jgi:hypothetical protein
MITRFFVALSLAVATAAAQQLPWDKTDLGPFHSGTFKIKLNKGDQVTAKGIAIKAGGADAKATVLFDTETLRWVAAWTGGFIEFPRGRGGLEGQINAKGTVLFSTKQAPGWSAGEIGDDPRPDHQGHLDPALAKWRGLHVNGDHVVLNYTVGNTTVLEAPGSEQHDGKTVFTRTFTTTASRLPLNLLVADLPEGSLPRLEGNAASFTYKDASGGDAFFRAQLISPPAGAKLEVIKGSRLVLRLPALAMGATFQVELTAGPASEMTQFPTAKKNLAALTAFTKGGPARWGEALEVAGKISDKDDPYVIDDIPVPEPNPYNSWMRIGGHDFFPDGTAAVVNVSGDVWLVSGLDEKLDHVKWKRIATGLFQPLGCKVVDGLIYVLGRDQITRLRDLNKDGEIDYYECFNNDCVVYPNYHEFALDLVTDRAGNFYYAKGSPWEPTVMTPHQGTLVRVSKDGLKFDIVATGLRAPNGLGMGPQDQITVSDNQGHWIPANRLNLVRPGGFYGMVPAAHKELTFKRADGTEFRANPSTEAARQEFKTKFWGSAAEPIPTEVDPPLCWLPMNVDNSPGGEVWVPPASKVWGPLAGQMLHMSYGHCILYGVVQEKVGDVTQGGVYRIAGKFPSGIMRGVFHPKDGQLYVSGLNVWQSDGVKLGSFSRVRYTGKTAAFPAGIKTTKAGVTLTFTAPLDEASATDRQNWSLERWNYRWTGTYGSKDYSVSDPTKTLKDLVLVDSIRLGPDKRTLTIDIPDMGPAMQMKYTYRFKTADGRDVANELYTTVNKMP